MTVRKPCGNGFLHVATPLAKWACPFSVKDHPPAARRRQRRPQKARRASKAWLAVLPSLRGNYVSALIVPRDVAMGNSEKRGECIWQATSENNPAETTRKQCGNNMAKLAAPKAHLRAETPTGHHGVRAMSAKHQFYHEQRIFLASVALRKSTPPTTFMSICILDKTTKRNRGTM